jgi:uncharacterized protein
MEFNPLPSSAAWRHVDAREGFEALFVTSDGGSRRLAGHTAAVEEGEAWVVRYEIEVDDHWATRTARVWGWSGSGERTVEVEADGAGAWSINGSALPELDGCFDLDLESSACTNTLPVHRLGLEIGDRADAPAVYVRALGLEVERLDQSYQRVADDGARQCYDYRSPTFDFEAYLVYDESGLVLEYPGIAARSL